MNQPENKTQIATSEKARLALIECRDAQLKIVEELSAKFEVAKEELKKLDKAVRMWEPKK